MTKSLEAVLDLAVRSLTEELGQNLYSCCVYGSAVRGNFVQGVSDINLLILLERSEAAAHQSISRVMDAQPQIDPFILSRGGFERSARAFASKFANIKRNYRVLCGADPLAELRIDPMLERFLCEQALRNFRLRLVYAFVTRHRNKAFDKFIVKSVTPLFVQISEVMRLNGASVPKEFEARISLMEKEFKIQGAVLRDLLSLKQSPRALSEAEAITFHEKLFPVLDAVVAWIESKWAGQPSVGA